ncbi:MAG: formate/nitrite transporter family protein [Gemmatimonadota bacterium]
MSERTTGGLVMPAQQLPADSGVTRDGVLRSAEVEQTFERTVAEGRERLTRGWGPLIATGLVGGTDVALGVLAYLLVRWAAGPGEVSHLEAGLAFSIGFIALTLARSELFTENFLVPVITVITRQSTYRSLLRLWWVTAVANLVSGWLIVGLIMAGFPQLRHVAIEAGAVYVDYGIGWRAFALALLGGAVITLMTWMQHGFESYGVKLVSALVAGWLLGAGGLNHAIVGSLLMFAGLHTGVAPYGYLAWFETAGWAALGNAIGGILLVTVLRLLQVPHGVLRKRAEPAPEVAAIRSTRRDGLPR